MAALPITDFNGSYTVTQGELIGAFDASGIRIEPLLRVLAAVRTVPPAGDTLDLSEYAGTYDFTADADRDEAISRAGPRGWSWFTAMQPYKA